MCVRILNLLWHDNLKIIIQGIVFNLMIIRVDQGKTTDTMADLSRGINLSSGRTEIPRIRRNRGVMQFAPAFSNIRSLDTTMNETFEESVRKDDCRHDAPQQEDV